MKEGQIFQPGQMVRCIDGDITYGLIDGHIYEVKEMTSSDTCVRLVGLFVDNSEKEFGWYTWRFDPVDEESARREMRSIYASDELWDVKMERENV